MRYHYNKPDVFVHVYGERYICDHPVYSVCTLFKIGKEGLGVVQQRFRESDKSTYWTEIDPWLANDLYLNPGFLAFFEERAQEPTNEGLYPTVSVRQIMWALKMKPLPKQRWETVFDRRDI